MIKEINSIKFTYKGKLNFDEEIVKKVENNMNNMIMR